MKYKVKKIIHESDNDILSDILYTMPALSIENYLWTNNSYKPKVEIKLCYTDQNIFVLFQVYERKVKATLTNINDLVYKDSCVEFFLNLFPNSSNAYMNFEINAIGTIYVAYRNTKPRILLPIEDIKNIKVKSSLSKPVDGLIENDKWEIKLVIPIKLLEKYFNQSFVGGNAKVNFYKCGDETANIHYGCWNRTISEKPNFHLPEYFGELIFLQNAE